MFSTAFYAMPLQPGKARVSCCPGSRSRQGLVGEQECGIGGVFGFRKRRLS
jgi:hypothetical protein